MRHDLDDRHARTLSMGPGAGREFQTMLEAACHARARLVVFFPPDHMAIQARYQSSDAAGLAAFKQTVREAVARHGARCPKQVALFDFLTANALTSEPMQKTRAPIM